MYRVDRNNFYNNQKDATVDTPNSVSTFVFNILKDALPKKSFILDPCVGKGSLLYPFQEAGFETLGIDIEYQGFPNTVVRDFITLQKDEVKKPDLVIANPPFNVDKKTKDLVKSIHGGRPLLPEVWLAKTIELWGKDTPMVLFAPYGMRLNQTVKSKRWIRFLNGDYPEITSIVSLPKDIYKDVLFHSEILLFNVDGIKPHYFFTE